MALDDPRRYYTHTGRGVPFVGELTKNLFQHVLNSDQPDNSTIFVHHHRHGHSVATNLVEQLVDVL